MTILIGAREPLAQAFDLATAPNGDLFIANTNAGQLLRWDGASMHVAYPGDFAKGENEFTGVATQSDGSVVFTTGLAEKWLRPDKTLTDIRTDEKGDQVLGLLLATGPKDEIYLVFGREGDVELLGTDGTLTPYAGTGSITTQAAVVGDGGPAVQAQFGRISDVVVDSQGVMYLADEGQGVVRRVKPDGTIDTVLGLGATRLLEAPDGTLAADLKLGPGPLGVTVDAHDNLYVSVRSAGRVIRIDHATGVMTRDRTRHDVPEPDSAHVRPRTVTSCCSIEDGKQVVSIAGVAELTQTPDEPSDEVVRRVRDDLVGRADLLDATGPHDDELIADRSRLGVVVRDVDRGHADPVQQLLEVDRQPFAERAVERAERLVEHEEARLRSERAGERDPLLLAARERGHRAAVEPVEVDEGEHLLDAAPALLPSIGLACAGRTRRCRPRPCAGTARSPGT